MKFDSKVKGALAWAGLFVILAVPSADLLFGPKNANANLALTTDKPVAPAFLTPTAVKTQLPAETAKVEAAPVVPAPKLQPVQTAAVATPAATTGDPVDTFIASGKKLPAYISDADTAPAATPAVVAQPVDVAAVAPVTETPPVPMPRDARPKASMVASAPTTPANGEQPLIIDENGMADRQASLDQPKQPVEPFPMSDGGAADEAKAKPYEPLDDKLVTGDQLEEWDSGSLADYLARKGLLSDSAVKPDDSDSTVVFNQEPVKPRRPEKNFFLF